MPTPNALIVDTIVDETGTGVSVFEGEHTASEIAVAIGTAVGLPVSWQTDDYTLFDGFDASGDSAEQAIRDLAKPMMLERRAGFSVFEPFSTDFYMAGEVAVVKKRQGITATPEYILTAANLGAVTISITKTRLPIWGQVTLVGRSTSNSLQQTPPSGSGGGEGTTPDPTVPAPTTPAGAAAGDQGFSVSGTDVTLSSFHETRHSTDGSITQTQITKVVLMPDNLPRQIRTTRFVSSKNGSGLILSSSKLETWDYLHFGYDNKGPRAHAKARQLGHAPMPPGAEFVVKTWPPQVELNLVDRPPAFIPYETPVGLPPATGHYSAAEQPWRCGRCRLPIVAWRPESASAPGRMTEIEELALPLALPEPQEESEPDA